MILREWRGRASASKAEAYPVHFRTKVLPELARVPGYLGADLGKRQIGDTIEFLVLTAGEISAPSKVSPDARSTRRLSSPARSLR